MVLNLMNSVIKRGNWVTDTDEERPHEDTGRDSHLQAKGRGLRRNHPCQHLDLGLLTPRSETVTINFCC